MPVSAGALLIGIVLIMFAGFTQGLTSFGFALISVPVLSGFIPLKVVVPVVVILSLFSNLAILWEAKKDVQLRKIRILILSSLAGAPFGTYILRVMEAQTLKIWIGILIICFAILLIKGASFHVRNEKWAFVPVGLTSGLLNGSISLSGPPVALFLSNQGVDKAVFRANLTAYGIILNISTVLTFWISGLLNEEVVRYTGWFLPAMFAGVYGGVRTMKRVSEKSFKRMTLYLLIVSGGWTLLAGLNLV